MQTTRFLCGLALPAALLLGSLGVATAQRGEGTPEARQACTPDAMRLCSQFIPDAGKVKTCMLSKRGQLSQACRVAMRGGAPRGGATRGRAARVRSARATPRRKHRARRVVRVHHTHRG